MQKLTNSSLRGGNSLDWRLWSLSDWNDALVSAVFLDKARLDIPITRIGATDRFLVECTKDQTSNPSEVQKAFIRSFGRTPKEIRDNFCYSKVSFEKFNVEALPKFFSQLYLTLLAASADEKTIDEGDFRKRFSVLVPVAQDIASNLFSDLPKFWHQISQWANLRYEKYCDCRRLELPDPGHETLIGISKKLAFPSYKDEVKLEELLHQNNFRESTPFHLVYHAVYKRISLFSENFKNEVDSFNSLVWSGNNKDAFESPFWCAVQDISWESQRRIAEKSGRYCLSLDTIDPSCFELNLLCDKKGGEFFSKEYDVRIFKTNNVFDRIVSGKNGDPCIPNIFGSIANKKGISKHIQLWRNFALGCIAFFPDEDGQFTTESTFQDGLGVGFLMQEGLARTIVKLAKFYQIALISPKLKPSFDKWRMLLIPKIILSSLVGLIRDLPEEVQSSIVGGWRPEKISLRGGARFGQTLLFNPASVPTVNLDNARSGEYQIFDESEKIIANGVLDIVDDGFRIPSKDVVAIKGAKKLRVELCREDGVCSRREMLLVTEVPMLGGCTLENVHRYLTDGGGGNLSELSVFNSSTSSSIRESIKDSSRITPEYAMLISTNDESWGVTEYCELNDISPIYDWLCEALSLRFQTRKILTFQILKEHVASACLAVGESRWLTRKILFATDWLVSIQPRTSMYSVLTIAERTIAIHRGVDRPVVRIVGMMTKYERTTLQNMLEEDEFIRRIGSINVRSLGVIEIQLNHPKKIETIAKYFSLKILTIEEFGCPLVAIRDLQRPIKNAGDDFPTNIDLEKWDGFEFKLIPDDFRNMRLDQCSLIRSIGSQKYTYFVFANGVHWETDSFVWALIFFTIGQGSSIGQIAKNGDCLFDRALLGIPPNLSRWWLHWGGGCISVEDDGSIAFLGGGGKEIWSSMIGWLLEEMTEIDVIKSDFDMAFSRRKYALQRRISEKKYSNY